MKSTILAEFVVSIYILGFAFGPLLIAPMSELYGRAPVYNVCNLFFVVFTVCCAVSTNMGMLIAFRFLAGCAGASPLTIGGGTIADIMPREKRAGAMAIWGMGPLLGPVLGPVCGGFLVQAKGWRWVFWIVTIFVRRLTRLESKTDTNDVLGWFLLVSPLRVLARNLCPGHSRTQSRKTAEIHREPEPPLQTRK